MLAAAAPPPALPAVKVQSACGGLRPNDARDLAVGARRAVDGPRRAAVLAALTRSLRGRPPDVVVVLENLHWADEATLDVLRLLARRIESLARSQAGAEAARLGIVER
jgi:hypothetical protein